jgi:hypothetical protein
MAKTFAVMGLATGLLAASALIASAQMTTVDPGLAGGAPNSQLGPSGDADSANGANDNARRSNRRNTITEPTNRLGPGGSQLLPGGNGALGAGDTTLGDWTGTNPSVNRNLGGYTYAPPNAFGSPSVAPGRGPPPGVSR